MDRGFSPRARQRRTGLFGAAMVLAGLGMGLGAIASTVTATSRRPTAPGRTTSVGMVMTASAGDSLGAARAWAREAYPFGLRECPRVTDDYYAACMDQMRQEAKAEAESRSVRAEWAASEPPPAYIPEPELEPAFEPAVSVDARAESSAAPESFVPIGTPLPDDLDGQVAPEVSSPPAG